MESVLATFIKSLMLGPVCVSSLVLPPVSVLW